MHMHAYIYFILFHFRHQVHSISVEYRNKQTDKQTTEISEPPLFFEDNCQKSTECTTSRRNLTLHLQTVAALPWQV